MTREKSPPMHIIFIGAFVFKDGKLLLGQRSMDEGHLPGYWAVPGGKVEVTNQEWNILQKTAQEEVMEETGVTISDEATMFTNNSFTRTDGRPVIAINFACHYVAGEPQPLDGTAAVMWASEAELADLKIEANTLKQMKMAFSIQARD